MTKLALWGPPWWPTLEYSIYIYEFSLRTTRERSFGPRAACLRTCCSASFVHREAQWLCCDFCFPQQYDTIREALEFYKGILYKSITKCFFFHLSYFVRKFHRLTEGTNNLGVALVKSAKPHWNHSTKAAVVKADIMSQSRQNGSLNLWENEEQWTAEMSFCSSCFYLFTFRWNVNMKKPRFVSELLDSLQ